MKINRAWSREDKYFWLKTSGRTCTIFDYVNINFLALKLEWWKQWWRRLDNKHTEIRGTILVNEKEPIRMLCVCRWRRPAVLNLKSEFAHLVFGRRNWPRIVILIYSILSKFHVTLKCVLIFGVIDLHPKVLRLRNTVSTQIIRDTKLTLHGVRAHTNGA